MTPIMAKSMQAAVVPAFRQDCTPYDDRNANRCDRWLPEALRRARSDAPPAQGTALTSVRCPPIVVQRRSWIMRRMVLFSAVLAAGLALSAEGALAQHGHGGGGHGGFGGHGGLGGGFHGGGFGGFGGGHGYYGGHYGGYGGYYGLGYGLGYYGGYGGYGYPDYGYDGYPGYYGGYAAARGGPCVLERRLVRTPHGGARRVWRRACY